MTEYIYKVVREYPDGSRAKRKSEICRYRPELKIGFTSILAGFLGCSGSWRWRQKNGRIGGDKNVKTSCIKLRTAKRL